MPFSEYDSGTVLALMTPGDDVHLRFRRAVRNRSAVQQPVEELGRGLGRGAAKHEDAAGIFIKVEESGFLDIG